MALLQIRLNRKYWLGLALGSLNVWLLSVFNHPVLAAERIRLSYGIFERTISIDALETYVWQQSLKRMQILAATDPDGLTLLNMLRQFPLEELEVDLARGQNIARTVDAFVSQTNQAVAQVN